MKHLLVEQGQALADDGELCPVVEQHCDERLEERSQVQLRVVDRVAVEAGPEEQGARHERIKGNLQRTPFRLCCVCSCIMLRSSFVDAMEQSQCAKAYVSDCPWFSMPGVPKHWFLYINV